MEIPGTSSISARNDVSMNQNDKLARMRAEELSDELAIGKEERSMARVARQMEDGLKELETAETLAERQIEDEWHREHHGREPEDPPNWREHKR